MRYASKRDKYNSLFQNLIQKIFNQSPKGIYNLFNSSLAVVNMPTIQDECRNTCLKSPQVTMEKYGRLIYVNANKPRHRVMRTLRAHRAGGSHEARQPNVPILRN